MHYEAGLFVQKNNSFVQNNEIVGKNRGDEKRIC